MNQKDLPPLPDNAIFLVKSYFLEFQKSLRQKLEAIDVGAHFFQDHWQRPEGGGGISAVLEKGSLFSKACVNFSHVCGNQLPSSSTVTRQDLGDASFHATGVSIVIHPDNPMIPTVHANVRFFVAERANAAPLWWFGGGMDLTPYYGFKEDCQHWHQKAYDACRPFGEGLYAQFKKNCDDYFFLKHRNEARGIGGLFFDDYNEVSFEDSFALTKSIAEHFALAFVPIVEKRKSLPFTAKEKAFQLYRRGRYVEFNLIYDRGTLFGLQSGGRTESILLSLPPEVHWAYNWQPESGSAEEKLYTDFLPAKNWLE